MKAERVAFDRDRRLSFLFETVFKLAKKWNLEVIVITCFLQKNVKKFFETRVLALQTTLLF
jgi:hypothetical protein